MAWPCDCCGHRTLALPPVGSLEVCPVCGWQDVGRYGWWHATGWNSIDLETACRSFAATGACEPGFADLVRAPRPGEERPGWWATPAETRERLVRDFEAEFRGITLGGGISLREADMIDDYAISSRTEDDPPPPGFGRSPPWEDLGEADLSECRWGPFVFMDARGLRYYTPALARFHLLRGRDPNSLSSLVGALEFKVEQARRLFTPGQRRVTAEWLFYVVRAPDSGLEAEAARALRKGWGAEIDEERRAMVPEW